MDLGGLPPLLQSSASKFMRGSVPPSSTPVQNPSVSSSCSHHTAPGGFHGGSRPPPLTPGPAPVRRPDPDEGLPLSPPSCRGSLPSSVSFGGRRSGSSGGGVSPYGGHSSSSSSVGPLSGVGYHGGRSSSPSLGSHAGISSSFPSLGIPLQSPASDHPLKCPLLGDLGLKIIEVGGGKGRGVPALWVAPRLCPPLLPWLHRRL